MASDNEKVEAIEACRTCGIYYMTTSNYLKPIFQSPVEQPEMMLIRLELAQWKVEVTENDGYPQYLCSTCIHEFQRVFKFRTSCVETQEQFRHFYSIREENRANIKIKTELPDPTEEKAVCDFIYVDELSDTEYDGATPFNIPHVPIKEEQIEAATIPMEDSEQSINMVESASRVVVHSAAGPSLMQPQLPVQNEINKPLVVVQMQPEPVECKLCQHLSASLEEHKQHMQRAHEIKDIDCNICGKKFKNSTPARLKFHMKWHNLNKHVKCNLCGFYCNSKEALQEHKRANHGKINCKICGKGVLAKKMKSHLREHELLTKYPCEYCTAAFSSENERESHIWQIHANDDDHNDNHQNPATSNHTILAEDADNLSMPTEEEEEELLRDDETTEDRDNFKFLCAHCEEKFMQQIDLEIHVNHKHRPKSQLTTTTNELETPAINQNLTLNTIDMPLQEAHNDNVHTAIAVFDDYDNEKHSNELQQQDETNDLSSLDRVPTEHHDASFTQTDNLTNPPENVEDQHEDENDEEDHDQEVSTNEHFDVQTESQNENSNTLAQSSSESDTSVTSETDEEEETAEKYIPSYVDNEMNSFVCAKCSDRFATIEQLRVHHERHFASTKQQPETPSKAKFNCHICAKTFDLKFSLNRHIKKHKHAPF